MALLHYNKLHEEYSKNPMGSTRKDLWARWAWLQYYIISYLNGMVIEQFTKEDGSPEQEFVLCSRSAVATLYERARTTGMLNQLRMSESVLAQLVSSRDDLPEGMENVIPPPIRCTA
jgi:hypothetical protein